MRHLTAAWTKVASACTFTETEIDTGGSKWPVKMTLHAHVGGTEVGTLRVLLSKTRRKAYVDLLEVKPDYRRQGHATALMDEFVRRYPDTRIDHGDRTDDGKAWWKAYS
jgi:ribosomal protein S18 acetylase RimI-like enzyme